MQVGCCLFLLARFMENIKYNIYVWVLEINFIVQISILTGQILHFEYMLCAVSYAEKYFLVGIHLNGVLMDRASQSKNTIYGGLSTTINDNIII